MAQRKQDSGPALEEYRRKRDFGLRRTLGRAEREGPAFDRGSLPKSHVHWAEPEFVAQVAFTEWTCAGQLRHLRYLGLRRDKDPATVIREAARP